MTSFSIFELTDTFLFPLIFSFLYNIPVTIFIYFKVINLSPHHSPFISNYSLLTIFCNILPKTQKSVFRQKHVIGENLKRVTNSIYIRGYTSSYEKLNKSKHLNITSTIISNEVI